MNGQKVKLPAMILLRSLGKSKSTAVRHWLSSKTPIRRIERRLLRLNGKLMNQAELKKLKSQDKSSFLSKSKRLEKLLRRKSLLLLMRREKELERRIKRMLQPREAKEEKLLLLKEKVHLQLKEPLPLLRKKMKALRLSIQKLKITLTMKLRISSSILLALER